MPIQSREDMRCPTCGARQEWADTCRRCKCDLRLLRAAARAYEHHRRRCLEYLSALLPEPALRHASRCHSIDPGGESQRLMALCQLLRENWADAWAGARAVLDSEQSARQ